MNNLQIISGVSCYEEKGTAYLRLEDVARGLGFTTTQNIQGTEYTNIRWKRVDEYLEELGFATCGKRPDYIPENIFYRLAMKAKNETAEKFQALVADEIIPSIRKTGAYGIPPERLAKLDEYQAKLDRNRKLLADIERYTAQAGRQAYEARKRYDEWRKTREEIRDNVRFWEECIAQEIRQLSEGAVQ